VTKKVILSVISSITDYQPEFEEYIKLRILSLEQSEQISDLAKIILSSHIIPSDSITKFNMKKFIHKNSKETIEKLCQFIR